MSPKLCKECEKLDLKSLLYVEYDKGSYEPGCHAIENILLGKIREINQRAASCEFCTLIVGCLKAKHKTCFNKDDPPIITQPYMDDAFSDNEDSSEDKGLVHSVPYVPTVRPIEQILLSSNDCYLNQKQFCLFACQRGEKEDKFLALFRLSVSLEPDPWVPDSFPSEFEDEPLLQPFLDAHRPIQLAESGVKGRKRWPGHIPLAGSGRYINSVVDIDLIRCWVQTCEKDHGESCSSPDWIDGGLDLPPSFRVIDVLERRVVTATLDCRFVALSYVWGNKSEARKKRLAQRLTTDNLNMAEQPGGLDAMNLAPTVSDALHLVAAIGERYLWVDSLCIVQDDPINLLNQTAKMDQVYCLAFFTIVAAAGEDADAGLPGMETRRRDLFKGRMTISDDTLSIAPAFPLTKKQQVQFSKWNTRGWTFQERVLSRRVLYFTETQVYWTCEISVLDEGVHLESSNGLPITYEPELQMLGCTEDSDQAYDKFSHHSLTTYIGQYSLRSLTYPSDVFPAFQGLVNRYEGYTGRKLHWGLVTPRFDQSLAWRGGHSRRREVRQIVLEDGAIHQIPLPSWSWLGWCGSVSATRWNEVVHAGTLTGRFESHLSFYSLMSDDSVQLIGGCSPEEKTAYQNRFRVSDGESEDEVDSDDSNDETEDDVDDGEYEDSYDGSSPREAGDIGLSQQWMSNCEVKGPVCPSVLEPVGLLSSQLAKLGVHTSTPPRPANPLPVYDTGRLVFWTSHAKMISWTQDGALNVLVRQKKRQLGSSLPGESVFVEQEMLRRKKTIRRSERRLIDYIVIGRRYESFVGEPKCELYIMLIQEKVEEPGVWGRIGIASIRETHWLQLEREWKLVVLE